VKGRAIRTCSHADLPPEERVVNTYFYIMKFSDAQKKTMDKTLQLQDKSKTTDQKILEIAESKEKLNNSILNLMKLSAVDCQLNRRENGLTEACYFIKGTAPTGMTQSMDYMFHPILEEHMKESRSDVRIIAKAPV
jgi:uncharacterized FAD-dependent dehydrogenase